MKPILRDDTVNKSTLTRAYELIPTEEFLPLQDAKIIKQIVDEDTKEVKSVTAVGINGDLFVIQQVQFSFGGGIIQKEGIIESLLNKKIYGELAWYIGEYLNDLMPFEYISDIDAYKGDYEYNGEKLTIYYSGTKELIWLSGKPFKGNEFKEKDDLTKYFNFNK
jgi:hypothetical protein